MKCLFHELFMFSQNILLYFCGFELCFFYLSNIQLTNFINSSNILLQLLYNYSCKMLLQLLLVAMVITNCFIHVVTSLVVLCLLHVAFKLTTQCYSCSMLLLAVVIIDVIIVAYLMVASSSCCLCFRCYKLLWSLHAINSLLNYFTIGEGGYQDSYFTMISTHFSL